MKKCKLKKGMNKMVDYGFIEKIDAQIENTGKVGFFDADLSEEIEEPTIRKLMPGDKIIPSGKQLTTTDLVREKIKAGKKNIEKMKKEADALTVEDRAGFNRSVEMIGQLKNLKKSLTDAVNHIIQPIYQEYKEGRNILTAFTPNLDKIQAAIQKKQDDYAYKAEMKRREDARKAAEDARKLQAKIDAEQKKIDDAEKAAAKKEEREPQYLPPIKVDTPVIPKEIKTKTESGSAKIEMVLVHTITDINSTFLHQLILDHCGPAYKTLADQACKKAIKAGAIGLAGAEGITVEEKAITKHRRR